MTTFDTHEHEVISTDTPLDDIREIFTYSHEPQNVVQVRSRAI